MGVVMLSVFILSVAIKSIMQSVIMLSVIMLSVMMLSVMMLSVMMLSVIIQIVADCQCTERCYAPRRYAEDCFTKCNNISCAQCHLVNISIRLITQGVIMPSVSVLNVVSTPGRLCKLWPVL